MSAPGKSFLAIGTAFAAGIAVTAAFVGGRPERPQVQPGVQPGVQQSGTGGSPVAAQAPRAVGLAPDARRPEPAAQASADPWVDPVRQRAAGSSVNPPLPPLVFHLDRKQEQAKAGPLRSSQGAVQGADEEVARQAAVAVPPPRRPSASELLARTEPHRDSEAATDTADGHSASRSPVFAPVPKAQAQVQAQVQAPRQTASTLRRTAGSRPAASDSDQDDVRLAAVRQSRRVYVARRDDADPAPGYYPPRHVESLDRYERDGANRVTAPRRRVTSAESGGVLRWLDQP